MNVQSSFQYCERISGIHRTIAVHVGIFQSGIVEYSDTENVLVCCDDIEDVYFAVEVGITGMFHCIMTN